MSLNEQLFWIKGDPENPTGRAVFYAEVGKKPYALFAGTNLADIIIVEKVDPKAIDALLTGIVREQREPTTITLPIPITTVTDLQTTQADIIHIGVYKTLEECVPRALIKAGNYLQRIKSPKEMPRYTPRTGKLTEKMRNEYVNPLIEAYRKGNYTRANEIMRQTFDYFKGTTFVKDVYTLLKHIYDTMKPNKELVDAILAKMQAIHDENYEEAAKQRDLVKQLTQATGQTPSQ